MINEKPQESTSFPFPYFKYAEKNLSIAGGTEAYLTLTFSHNINWANIMISSIIQQGSIYTNIEPVSASSARIRAYNYNTSGGTVAGTVRVMALLPATGGGDDLSNVTMTLT